MMNSTMQIQPSTPPKEPIIAALLSLILLGGVGQLWLGQQKKGIILVIITLILDFVCGLGLFLHVIGAIDAYMIADKLKKGSPVGDMEWFWQK